MRRTLIAAVLAAVSSAVVFVPGALGAKPSVALGAKPSVALGGSQLGGLVRERVIDYARPPGAHGGPPASGAMVTDFKLAKQHWVASATVGYTITTAGCGTSQCATLVNAGFDAWQSTSGLTFTQNSSSNEINLCTDAPNSVSWQSIDGPGNVLAETFPCYYLGSGQMAGFDIVFDSGDAWSNCGSVEACTGQTAISIQATATHEAGHVVGLNHVSAPRDGRLTMYPYIDYGDWGFSTLGCGDQLGVAKQYHRSFTCTAGGTVPLD
jgi:Matrixin